MPDISPGHPPLAEIRRALLAWFDASARVLPWRQGPEGGRDPYRVWVAEILLQQTQVSRGLLYYERFLENFPTVQALAQAPQDAVLKAWEGCGYYARARNLHRAAQEVAARGFPQDYAGWLALPGVGPYTAAAVSSLAYGERRAVNDGNVRRVLARLLAEKAPTDTWVQAQASAFLDPCRPAAWNEAVMDLGATICTPKAPQCPACPLQSWCAAAASGTPAAYPAPKKRAAARPVQAVALLVGSPTRALLEHRSGSLLGGLYGLPLEDWSADKGKSAAEALARLQSRLGVQGTPEYLGEVTHAMTHRRLNVQVYLLPAECSPRPLANVTQAALSRLDHKVLALLEGQRPLFD